jgi:DnaK suppressor protein
MQQSEMERFRLILESMLKDTARPKVQREDIAVENAPDAVDHSQRAAEREMAIHQIESNFNRAQNIKLALERIADGSYGTCLRCDCDISLKRLEAVPWAAYCIQCQDMADRERKQPEDGRLQALLHLKDVA